MSMTAEPEVLQKRWAYFVGLFCFAVFGLWWVGFYPAISTVDSMQAWDQAKDWVFVDWHPVFHTWMIAVLTRVWFSAGAVILAQIAGLALVLGSLTRRFQRAGVHLVVAIGLPCLIALSPQTGNFSIVLWKDIPFAISVLWMFVEVFDIATDPARYFVSRWRCARFGTALLAVLLFRQNGVFVAGIVIVGVVVAYRRYWAELALPVVIAAGGYIGVTGPLYTALDAWPTPTLFSYTTFMHDMAAFVNDHGDDMSPDELAFLAQILPINRWKAPNPKTNPDGLYFCRQATPLIFPREFYPSVRLDRGGRLVAASTLPKVIVQNPESVFLDRQKGEFRSLWFRFVRRWPGTFLGHRFCVGSLAWSPWHKTGLKVFQPPRASTVKTPELAVRPLSRGVNRFLDRVLKVWDPGRRRVLTWRAVTWVYLGFVAVAVGAWRRRQWRYLVVVLAGFASWLSVLLFTPGQSGRYMFPAYLCALASLGLFAVRPTPTPPPTLSP